MSGGGCRGRRTSRGAVGPTNRRPGEARSRPSCCPSDRRTRWGWTRRSRRNVGRSPPESCSGGRGRYESCARTQNRDRHDPQATQGIPANPPCRQGRSRGTPREAKAPGGRRGALESPLIVLHLLLDSHDIAATLASDLRPESSDGSDHRSRSFFGGGSSSPAAPRAGPPLTEASPPTANDPASSRFRNPACWSSPSRSGPPQGRGYWHSFLASHSRLPWGRRPLRPSSRSLPPRHSDGSPRPGGPPDRSTHLNQKSENFDELQRDSHGDFVLRLLGRKTPHPRGLGAASSPTIGGRGDATRAADDQEWSRASPTQSQSFENESRTDSEGKSSPEYPHSRYDEGEVPRGRGRSPLPRLLRHDRSLPRPCRGPPQTPSRG